MICFFEDFSKQVGVLQIIVRQVEALVLEATVPDGAANLHAGALPADQVWRFCAGLAQLEIIAAEASWQAQLSLQALQTEEDSLVALLKQCGAKVPAAQEFVTTHLSSALQSELDELDSEVLDSIGSALKDAVSACAAAGLGIVPVEPIGSIISSLNKDRPAPLTATVSAAAKPWEVASPRLLRWARSSPVPPKLSSNGRSAASATGRDGIGSKGSGQQMKTRAVSPVLPTLPGQQVYMKRGMSGWVHVADSTGAHPASSWPIASTPRISGSAVEGGDAQAAGGPLALPQLGSRLWTPGGGPGAWPLSPSLLRGPQAESIDC